MSKVSDVYIYLKGEEGNTDGSKTYVEVTFQRYMLGPYNTSTNTQTVYLYFGLYIQARGASGGGEQSTNTKITFSLNGVRRETDADIYNTLLTYEVSGPLTSITIERLYAEGRSNIALGPAKTAWKSVEFTGGNINLINISNNANFVSVGSTKNDTKHLVLPDPTTYIGKSLFIKVKDNIQNYYEDDARHLVWIYPYRGGSRIDDSQYLWNDYSGIVLTISKSCLTLITNGSNWYITGNYTDSLQSTSTVVPAGVKKANASIGINIFSVNTNSARESGDNHVVLPTEVSGQLCIVVYAGNNSYKGGGNALSFSTTSGNGIDKRWNNTNNFPYIYTDESGEDEGKKKSTGIVFISDGTYWYVVGWYRPWCQGWENRSIVSSTQLTPSSYINFNYNPNTLSSDTYYTLPQYDVNKPNSYFYIFKSTNVTGGVGIVLSANPPGISTNPPTATTNIFNEGMNITYRGCCGGKGYQYVWVISYVKPGESRLRWYPILNDYANNAC